MTTNKTHRAVTRRLLSFLFSTSTDCPSPFRPPTVRLSVLSSFYSTSIDCPSLFRSPAVCLSADCLSQFRVPSLTTRNRKSRLGLGLGLENRKKILVPRRREVVAARMLRRLRQRTAGHEDFSGFLTLALTLVATFCFRLSVTSYVFLFLFPVRL